VARFPRLQGWEHRGLAGEVSGKSTLSHVPSDTIPEISITAIGTASKEVLKGSGVPGPYKLHEMKQLYIKDQEQSFTVNIPYKYFFY
jgi:hypothetical protein